RPKEKRLDNAQESKLIKAKENEHSEHNGMSWSTCYEDDCWVHKDAKNRHGWYPQKPTKRRTCDQMRSWNNCYRQSCKKHLREKIAAGYYPRIDGGHNPLTKRDEATRKRREAVRT